MSSLAEAMRMHAPQYLRELEQSESNIQIRRVLQAIMQCRTGALGGVKWGCTRCGHTHWTGRSCGNIEAVEDGRSVVAYLAPYVQRVAISDHRIKQ